MKIFKKLNLLISIILISGFVVTVKAADLKIAPYYSFSFSDGLTIPNKGEIMASANLVNDLGIILQAGTKHKIITFYELKYTGPGFRKQEGEKFSDRSMDHLVLARYHYAFLPDYTLKSQLDYMTEYKRTGSNEVWGSGLYDFNRTGGAIILDRKFDDDILASVQLQYHLMAFPNYTDLLTEFQQGGEQTEASTGKQDHTLYQGGLTLNYGASKASADLSMLSYKKQKVVTDAVQADGTYYSSALQNDMTMSFGVEHNRKLWNFILISPSISYKIKTSNQNYQHFTVATSTVPVKYLGNYYDYMEYDILVPISFLLGKKWEFFCNSEWDMKTYSSRPPRDENNVFVEGKQGNILTIFSTGFTYKPNDITRTTFFYTYQNQISNMKFEKYLPYNYDGHSFGINFNYSY